MTAPEAAAIVENRALAGHEILEVEPGPFGVYVHIPFCTSRCDYCAFATFTDRFSLVEEYVRACALAARRLVPQVGRRATSVFFGGGTPSLLSPALISTLVEAVGPATGAEVTVECNPETVDAAKLAGYRDAGVSRLSFGVQSMAPHVLAGLGRRHDPVSVCRAVDAATDAGFGGRFSLDLIMGGAGETLADWSATLDAAVELEPAHISAYGLTVEPGTPLAADRRRHPDPDDQADKYLVAEERLSASGFGWYEISNWARPGSECRHNLLYWEQGEYLGIGSAAHSHRVDPGGSTARRWWNVRTPERYIASVAAGGDGASAGETLDALARRREALELRLRTSAGVPAGALAGWEVDDVLAGLVERHPADPHRVRLTAEGRLLANEVSLRLSV